MEASHYFRLADSRACHRDACFPDYPLYVLLGLILAIPAGVAFLWITTVLYYMALPMRR